ncbi:alpha/beta-type small acid-soluble spore protein [Desulfosporosinus fructosivorans]|uniref:Alpha/beta-type small acid-soluble spore protein n=1 Tax=Desulfosporosinus fructosivorans TaxID=2018669 RepID=A0A4Z0R1A0_9FIRM|nr:alpha/beta-type small acid-soluble spore protein [Desulfosporosinus fructosivorans]TGE36832.1 alpha/beta-type small acid-soluble spore protein [Desulfosporosinus fructosivorans]
MSRRNKNTNSILPDSVLEQFKWEVADELGLSSKIKSQGWENMTSRECGHVGGRIGGSIVKTMMRRAKDSLNTPM